MPASIQTRNNQLPVFYYDELTPQARSCLMLIQLLNVKVDMHYIDLFNGAHLKDDYSSINPIRTVPALVHGDVKLNDGHTILMYLCERFGGELGPKLFPNNSNIRYDIMSKLFVESNVLYRRHSEFLTELLRKKVENTDVEFHEKKILGAYEIFEKLLTLNKFLCGQEVTIADISCVSTISALDLMFPIEEIKYPKLFNWFFHMRSRAEYKYNLSGIEKQRELMRTLGNYDYYDYILNVKQLQEPVIYSDYDLSSIRDGILFKPVPPRDESWKTAVLVEENEVDDHEEVEAIEEEEEAEVAENEVILARTSIQRTEPYRFSTVEKVVENKNQIKKPTTSNNIKTVESERATPSPFYPYLKATASDISEIFTRHMSYLPMKRNSLQKSDRDVIKRPEIVNEIMRNVDNKRPQFKPFVVAKPVKPERKMSIFEALKHAPSFKLKETPKEKAQKNVGGKKLNKINISPDISGRQCGNNDSLSNRVSAGSSDNDMVMIDAEMTSPAAVDIKPATKKSDITDRYAIFTINSDINLNKEGVISLKRLGAKKKKSKKPTNFQKFETTAEPSKRAEDMEAGTNNELKYNKEKGSKMRLKPSMREIGKTDVQKVPLFNVVEKQKLSGFKTSGPKQNVDITTKRKKKFHKEWK